jgi:hypothetical protein
MRRSRLQEPGHSLTEATLPLGSPTIVLSRLAATSNLHRYMEMRVMG